MKVKELIAKLQECDQEAELRIEDPYAEELYIDSIEISTTTSIVTLNLEEGPAPQEDLEEEDEDDAF